MAPQLTQRCTTSWCCPAAIQKGSVHELGANDTMPIGAATATSRDLGASISTTARLPFQDQSAHREGSGTTGHESNLGVRHLVDRSAA